MIVDYIEIGKEIYEFEKIFPYNRFLMGEGVRKTLSVIKEIVPKLELQISTVDSGTKVFDWVIPDEWIIREAYIEDESGKKLLTIGKITFTLWPILRQ